MKKVSGKTKKPSKRRKAKDDLSPSDVKAIVHALERVKIKTAQPAPQRQKSLSEVDTYWAARNKALHNRKYHP